MSSDFSQNCAKVQIQMPREKNLLTKLVETLQKAVHNFFISINTGIQIHFCGYNIPCLNF